jgi:sterol desaturase/sphingolipid hydroxylase (fatty acid hydroxylase superfamily)
MFFPGFILGHLLYASLHYAVHAWPPPFKWMKPLWRNHYLHHYPNEEKEPGVTSSFWDGTMFGLKKHKEDKAKINALTFEKTTETSSAIVTAINYEQHLT